MNELISGLIGLVVGIIVQAKTDIWIDDKKNKATAQREVLGLLDSVEGLIHGLYGLYEVGTAINKYEALQKNKIESKFNQQAEVLSKYRSVLGEEMYRVFLKRNNLLRDYYAVCVPKNTKTPKMKRKNELLINLYLHRKEKMRKL